MREVYIFGRGCGIGTRSVVRTDLDPLNPRRKAAGPMFDRFRLCCSKKQTGRTVADRQVSILNKIRRRRTAEPYECNQCNFAVQAPRHVGLR